MSKSVERRLAAQAKASELDLVALRKRIKLWLQDYKRMAIGPTDLLTLIDRLDAAEAIIKRMDHDHQEEMRELRREMNAAIDDAYWDNRE